MKRLLDVGFSIIGLLILSPLSIIIAVFIKNHDRGSILYAPYRVGLDKELFRMYKFRTMVVDADKLGGPTTSTKDPRITPTGRVLRRFKLDELPQLINVLKGDMSLVGPRPEIPSEVESYESEWDVIFSVRPGITDFASIEFRNEGEIVANSGIEDAHEAYKKLIQPRKLELQRQYAMNHSLILDIKILWKTVLAVLR